MLFWIFKQLRGIYQIVVAVGYTNKNSFNNIYNIYNRPIKIDFCTHMILAYYRKVYAYNTILSTCIIHK